MDVSLPAFAHRVTVFGSTRNMVATSAGVSSGSASGVRAVMSGLLGRTEPTRFFPSNSAPWPVMPEMAHTDRVGNRTNGLSLTLQLHHPSMIGVQTARFAPAWVQQHRPP